MPALKAIRRRKLLTQAELAHEAGVASSTVYLIESGKSKHRPRMSVMSKLAKALGVEHTDVDEFRAALNMDDSSAS
jgi:transcriptional regulator with XRE-family HTH domain